MLKFFESEEPDAPQSSARVAELIHLARDGDLQAFGSLVELLSEDLARIVRRTVYTSRIDPEDIFQDSVLQAMHSIAALRNQTRAGFLSWFSGIARNRVLTLKAGAARRGTPNKRTPYPWLRMEHVAPELLDAPRPAEPPPMAEAGVCPMDPSINELTAVTRMGWLLREVFGMDWSSVALVLRKGSLAAARQTHYRALQNLGAPSQQASARASREAQDLGCRR